MEAFIASLSSHTTSSKRTDYCTGGNTTYLIIYICCLNSTCFSFRSPKQTKLLGCILSAQVHNLETKWKLTFYSSIVLISPPKEVSSSFKLHRLLIVLSMYLLSILRIWSPHCFRTLALSCLQIFVGSLGEQNRESSFFAFWVLWRTCTMYLFRREILKSIWCQPKPYASKKI